MATIKLVPKKDWEIVKEYLYADNGGAVVLVPESKLDGFSEEQAQRLRSMDGEPVDYAFGGEPDFYVEVLDSPNGFCAEEILSELENIRRSN